MHFECDAKERKKFAEEEYRNNSNEGQSLYQCDLGSGSHMTIGPIKLDKQGKDNFVMPQNTFSVSIPNLSTKQCSEDTQLMNTEVCKKIGPISFRDALLAQPAQIKKTTSMILVPTGKKQKTEEDELLTKPYKKYLKRKSLQPYCSKTFKIQTQYKSFGRLCYKNSQ